MKLALATTVAILSAGSAIAGGYTPPVVETTPVVIEPSQPETDWTGFYAGLQYGQGSADLDADGIGSLELGDFDAYGVHAGYLHDMGRYVLGAELDYNKVEPDEGDEDGDLIRLRGRAGIDLGRFMPYLTAGVARISADVGDDDLSETGFTFGIGADFAVTDKFTIGAEYSKAIFSDVLDVDGIDLDADLVQIRAAYHF